MSKKQTGRAYKFKDDSGRTHSVRVLRPAGSSKVSLEKLRQVARSVAASALTTKSKKK